MTRRIVGWIGLWLALLAIQLVLIGAPGQWALAWLLAMIGIDALLHALELRFGFHLFASITIVIAIGTFTSRLALHELDSILVIVGVLSAGLAWVLHRETLLRRQETYRPASSAAVPAVQEVVVQ